MTDVRKKRILTGDTPTGRLHVGHYVGTLENRVRLQEEYDTFIVEADTHALTTLAKKPDVIGGYTIETTLDNLAAGLDPEKVTFFAESLVPEIYELSAIFSMYVSHNTVLRNPTIKDEIRIKGLGDIFSLGFINYPIFQAADILSVKADLVPVGIDQEAHIEQTREIARAINSAAGSDIFREPKGLVGRIGRLPGTDGNPKMSKSLGNTIFLSETPDEVERKVMSMFTDPNRVHAADPGTVEGNPVFEYLDAFGTENDLEQVETFKEEYVQGTVGDVMVKKYLVGVMNRFLDPIRERRMRYEEDSAFVGKILRDGSERARHEANETLKEVKKALGFIL